MGGFDSQLRASFSYCGQLLCCARKRIVNTGLKVCIERNNIHVDLIRFRKQLSTLFTFTFARRDGSQELPVAWFAGKVIVRFVGEILDKEQIFDRLIRIFSVFIIDKQLVHVCRE